jgi:hypothetical protein
MKTISTLGKISKIVLYVLIITISLNAKVTATLDNIAIYQGDAATLTLSASGKDVNFPDISTINGYNILGRSSSSQMYIVNSKVTQKKSIAYTFRPDKSITIPSFEIDVDGVKQSTKPLKLKVLKPQISKQGDDVVFSLKLSKNKAYTGEAIYATYTFAYKVGTKILDVDLKPLAINHFWIKQLDGTKPIEENGYIKQTVNYILFPQLQGKQTIPSQILKVAVQPLGAFYPQWKKIASNEETIDVKALPDGLNVQGNYTIEAFVDNTTIKVNEPVNLTIKIKGKGNIDDIEPIKLNFDDQIVYSSKPQINTNIKNNIYQGNFIQKVSIISDKSYTIPAIKFRYFDIIKNKIITIKTKPIDINVEGKQDLVAPVIQTKHIQANTPPQIKTIIKKENSNVKYIYLVAGLLIGGLIVFFITKSKPNKYNDIEIVTRIKKAKNDKALYEVLLPYSSDMFIKPFMKELENNIYNSAKNKIDKKALIEYFDSN